MDGRPPESLVDARAVRFERVAIAVLLLGGFVFKIIWVIPGLAVVLAVAVGFGARGNVFFQVFQAVAEGRLRGTATMEPARAARFSELFAVAVLTIATLFFAISLNLLAWLVALIEAGICALHASTGLSVEAAIRDRLRNRRNG
jgi:Domain of unknown function (DUF4395)